MYRFFVSPENILEDEILINGDDYNHIKNVLRLEKGNEIVTTCGREYEYLCKIEGFDEEYVKTSIVDKMPNSNELPIDFILFQALPKGDKMDLIIQKNVELGISAIVPFKAKRCVVKYDEKKSEKKVKRWQEIARAAAKQSGRGIIPKVYDIMEFKDALNLAAKSDMALVPYELQEDDGKTSEILKNIYDKKSISFMIGPEGGFETGEIEGAKENGIVPITLGKRILRTETAGMALMSYLMLSIEMENENG